MRNSAANFKAGQNSLFCSSSSTFFKGVYSQRKELIPEWQIPSFWSKTTLPSVCMQVYPLVLNISVVYQKECNGFFIIKVIQLQSLSFIYMVTHASERFKYLYDKYESFSAFRLFFHSIHNSFHERDIKLNKQNKLEATNEDKCHTITKRAHDEIVSLSNTFRR